MTEQDAQDPRPTVRPPDIWGDDTPPSAVPLPPTGQPLDLSLDPDRVQPGPVRPVGPVVQPPRRPLDMSQDPDRYDRTLTEMLGEGAQEEERDNYVWLIGLLSMLIFLGVVAFIASNLGP